MASTTSVKFFCTNGSAPKKKPAPQKEMVHSAAPACAARRQREAREQARSRWVRAAMHDTHAHRAVRRRRGGGEAKRRTGRRSLAGTHHIVQQERGIRHGADARDERRERAHDGHEAREHNLRRRQRAATRRRRAGARSSRAHRLGAIFGEERLGLGQVLALEDAAVLRERLGAQPVALRGTCAVSSPHAAVPRMPLRTHGVVKRVAQHRGGEEQPHQQRQRQRAERRNRARRKQQRVARKERRHHQALPRGVRARACQPRTEIRTQHVPSQLHSRVRVPFPQRRLRTGGRTCARRAAPRWRTGACPSA